MFRSLFSLATHSTLAQPSRLIVMVMAANARALLCTLVLALGGTSFDFDFDSVLQRHAPGSSSILVHARPTRHGRTDHTGTHVHTDVELDSPGIVQEDSADLAPEYEVNQAPTEVPEPTGVAVDSGTMPSASVASSEQDKVAHEAARARYWRRVAGELSCQLKGFGPTGGFCLNPDAPGPVGNNADIDPKFADAMKDMVYPDGATVVDLGCGFGQYGKHWKFVGTVPSKLTWHGFDGSENIEKATDNEVTFFDLSELRALPLKAPLPAEHYRMSIEVAEHLPQDMEGYFIFHLFGSGGPMPAAIVFSWAVVGQGGHGHVNCQNYEYVQCLVEKVVGYDLDTATGAALRDVIEQPTPTSGSPTWWLRNTVFVLRRTARAEQGWIAEANRAFRDTLPGDDVAAANFKASYAAAIERAGCVPQKY